MAAFLERLIPGITVSPEAAEDFLKQRASGYMQASQMDSLSNPACIQDQQLSPLSQIAKHSSERLLRDSDKSLSYLCACNLGDHVDFCLAVLGGLSRLGNGAFLSREVDQNALPFVYTLVVPIRLITDLRKQLSLR